MKHAGCIDVSMAAAEEAAGGGEVAVEADGRGCGAGDVAGGSRSWRGELR